MRWCKWSVLLAWQKKQLRFHNGCKKLRKQNTTINSAGAAADIHVQSWTWRSQQWRSKLGGRIQTETRKTDSWKASGFSGFLCSSIAITASGQDSTNSLVSFGLNTCNKLQALVNFGRAEKIPMNPNKTLKSNPLTNIGFCVSYTHLVSSGFVPS